MGCQIRSSLVVVVGSKVLAHVLPFSGLVDAAVCPQSTSTPCGASFTSPQVSFVVRVVCPHPRPSMCLHSGPNVRRQSRTSSKHKVFPQMNLSFGPRGEARKSAQKAAVAAVFHLSRDGWLQNVHFVPRLSMSFGRHLGARALTAHVAVLNFGATCGDGSGVESPQLRTRRRRPSADR